MYYFYYKRFIAALEMNKVLVGVYKVPYILADFVRFFCFLQT